MLMFFALYPLISQAQEQEETQPPAKGFLVATVNIYNAKIVSQENNKITLSFDLNNEQKIQPGVKYAVNLVKNNQVIDQKVYDEVLSLDENATVNKEIVYEAPEYLSGDYDVWIISQNDRGLSLGLINVGTIKLNGSNEYIDVQSCYSQVQENGEKYALDGGAYINTDQTLIANCTLINNFSTEQVLTPIFNTYYRGIFGEKLRENKSDTIILSPKETRTISIAIPKVDKPQAYDAVLSFIDKDNKNISNKIVFRYVLYGVGATIQNLRLDKDYYAKDETAKISFYFVPLTDQKISLDLTINSENKACSETIKQELGEDVQIDLEAKINKDCPNPEAVAILKDEKGNVLDQANIKIASKNAPPAAPEESVVSQVTKNKNIAFLVVMLLALIAILALAIKKRKSISPGLLIFVLLGAGMFLGGAEKANAGTFTWSHGCHEGYGSSKCQTTVTFNINKSSFKPNETINESTNVSFTYSQNRRAVSGVGITQSSTGILKGTTKEAGSYTAGDYVSGSSSYSYTASFTAENLDMTLTPATFTIGVGSSFVFYYPPGSKTSSVNYGGPTGWGSSYTVEYPNTAPDAPTLIQNGKEFFTNISVIFLVKTFDPRHASHVDRVAYYVDWADGGGFKNITGGTYVYYWDWYNASHTYTKSGTYNVRFKAVDEHGAEGGVTSYSITVKDKFSCPTRPSYCSRCNNLDPTSNVGSWTVYDYGSCPSNVACTCQCQLRYKKSGSSCVSACNNCPANASTECPVSGLVTGSAEITTVSACPTTTNCLCKCDNNYKPSADGKTCVLNSQCNGGNPVNSFPCSIKTELLTQNEDYTTVASVANCPAAQDHCVAYCGPGYEPSADKTFCQEMQKKGECGDAAEKSYCKVPSKEDLCKSGSPSSVTLDGANWKWDCVGADEGIMVNCYTNKDCSWTEVNP